MRHLLRYLEANLLDALNLFRTRNNYLKFHFIRNKSLSKRVVHLNLRDTFALFSRRLCFAVKFEYISQSHSLSRHYFCPARKCFFVWLTSNRSSAPSSAEAEKVFVANQDTLTLQSAIDSPIIWYLVV